MRYRIAKRSDYKRIADIHYQIRDFYPVGIFSQLGKPFLRKYYRIMLDDPNEIILCAVNDNGLIIGFSSTTLDAEAQVKNFRRHRFGFAFAAAGSILRNPSLVRSLYQRYKSTSSNARNHFVTGHGVRGEFWGWDNSQKDSIAALELFEVGMGIVHSLGVKEFHIEVDTINKKIFLFHKLNGAKIVEQITLPDGRERVLMRYDVTNYTYKL